jgi:hypothetical protein
MIALVSLLRALTTYSVLASIMLGVAIGTTNVLINHMHWLSAYLIACPVRDRTRQRQPSSLPAWNNPLAGASTFQQASQPRTPS